MDFEALKRLDKNKDTVKKIDRYIQTLSVDSNDYYKAICYKASVLHALKRDDEALKILLPLEKKLWCLKNEDILVFADILKDIYFELNDPANALKYIKIKEDHLLLIDHDKYTKDMIEYYRFINDKVNEKRQILIYLEENINPDDLKDVYERLIDFAFEEKNKSEFDKYYTKLREYYLKVHTEDKLAKIDLYNCYFLFKNNIVEAYKFSTEKLSQNITNNEKAAYATVCIKYFMAQNEFRKASIVDSNFQEVALLSDVEYRKDYLNTTYELYKRLNNRYSMDLVLEEIEKLNQMEELPKEKKLNTRQIQKKLDIISQFENITPVKENTKEEKEVQTPKTVSIASEIKPRVDVTLNTYASGYYKLLNDAIGFLNESSKNQREPIRKALIELNKQIAFKEVHIIYKKHEGLLGYQFKSERLYDKSFKDEALISQSFIYESYKNQVDVYSMDSDFDIITLKESIFSLKIIYSFKGDTSLGAIAFFFNDEPKNFDYEILKTFSHLLEEFIKRGIVIDSINTDEKIKEFYINHQDQGFIKIIDEKMFLNDKAMKELNISTNIVYMHEFFDLIGTKDRHKVKGLFDNMLNGNIKSDVIIYSLNDKRLVESKINLFELKTTFIAVMSIEDVSLREKEKNALLDESLSDSLVNIKSIKALENDLYELYKEKKFSIMLIDAKDFKKYNDTYGIKFHNDLIKAIGLKLDYLKEKYKADIYHYDSDKFFIVIPNNDERNTIKIYGKLLDNLSEELFKLNNRVKLYFNGAILRVLLKSPKYSIEKIIDMLNNTLLGLKSENEMKNTLAYYDSKVADKVFYDFQMELHISEAIDKGLIKVSYNQIADFSKKGIFAYKAKLNLINAIVDESYFEGAIKKRNLELMIDKYIVSHALMELSEFKNKIGGVYNLVIPIHSTSMNKDFIEYYLDKLRFFKINPKNIYLSVSGQFPVLDLEYINLITDSLDLAIKLHAKFYQAKVDDYYTFDLKQVSDFLKLLGTETIVDAVSTKEKLDLLVNDFSYISGNILKGDYQISELILANKDNKVL